MALSTYGNYDVARSGRGRRKSAARIPQHLGALTTARTGGKSSPVAKPVFFWGPEVLTVYAAIRDSAQPLQVPSGAGPRGAQARCCERC